MNYQNISKDIFRYNKIFVRYSIFFAIGLLAFSTLSVYWFFYHNGINAPNLIALMACAIGICALVKACLDNVLCEDAYFVQINIRFSIVLSVIAIMTIYISHDRFYPDDYDGFQFTYILSAVFIFVLLYPFIVYDFRRKASYETLDFMHCAFVYLIDKHNIKKYLDPDGAFSTSNPQLLIHERARSDLRLVQRDRSVRSNGVSIGFLSKKYLFLTDSYYKSPEFIQVLEKHNLSHREFLLARDEIYDVLNFITSGFYDFYNLCDNNPIVSSCGRRDDGSVNISLFYDKKDFSRTSMIEIEEIIEKIKSRIVLF